MLASMLKVDEKVFEKKETDRPFMWLVQLARSILETQTGVVTVGVNKK